MKKYLTAKEIEKQMPVKAHQLKYYRLKGYLKDFVWSPGKRKIKFNINEIKEVFFI